MRSDAASVPDYIEAVADDRRASLRQMRADCLELLTGFEESMTYGMPCYRRAGGQIEVSFASQKQYLALYIMRSDVLDAHRARLPGLSIGKGCIRFRRPDQIDREVIRSMLAATAATPGPIC
jgi:uncharacterized protein YdhG (YjbR/CyaY superfamily)